MYHRFCAIFIVVCFAAAAAGCASKSQRNREEVLLPLQTGSYLNRRVVVDNESSFKKVERESKPSSKKRKKSEQREVAPTEPDQPEETPTPPEKFR